MKHKSTIELKMLLYWKDANVKFQTLMLKNVKKIPASVLDSKEPAILDSRDFDVYWN
jgi:hypothetical protein